MKTQPVPLTACGTAIRSASRPMAGNGKKKQPTAAGDLLAELMQELAVRDMSRRSDARQLRSRLA